MRRSLVVLEFAARGLVVAATVGLVIGPRLLGERFVSGCSRLVYFGSPP
jgi:hypothetical protein